MYEQYFSLKCKPFELIPNPDFLFMSSTHKKAITYLDYGIKERIGFILLTGEIGSGKTTIIRNLIKNLNGSVRLSRVNNTKVSSEQLLSMINEDFGLDIEGKGKTKLLSELNEFLIEEYANKHQPILLIDEAQNLSPELLEEIRLLSNLETDRAKLLQIILIGQPELKKTLMLPELRQLRQRININYHISPLSIDETARYIKHRLTVAGNPDVIGLGEDTIQKIYQFSAGIPRLINILCDFSLLTAYTEGADKVNSNIVYEVVDDLKARDFWNGSEQEVKDNAVRNEGNREFCDSAGSLALRLIQLEDRLQQNELDYRSVFETVMKLSDMVSKLNELTENDRISGLLERLEEKLACRILIRISEENKIPELLQRIARLEQGATDVSKKESGASTGENKQP